MEGWSGEEKEAKRNKADTVHVSDASGTEL